MAKKRAGKTRRGALSRRLVLEAALQLIDTDGLEALSMRRLAAALGVEAMSLYNHVPNKQAIIAGIIDICLADVAGEPAKGSSWKKWVREWLISIWRSLAAHPNLFPALVTDQQLGPHALGLADTLFARLADAGFDAQAQVRLWELLKAVLFGTMIQECADSSQGYSLDELSRYPHVVRVLPEMSCCQSTERLGQALDVVLAGAEASYLKKKR